MQNTPHKNKKTKYTLREEIKPNNLALLDDEIKKTKEILNICGKPHYITKIEGKNNFEG
jgi:hypothetical protein